MSLYRTLAYLAPLIVGFGVAAALALTPDRAPKRRAVAAGSVLGGALFLLLIACLTDSPQTFVPLALLLASVAVFVAGQYLLLESARLPRELCQLLPGLVLCFLMSTLFWAAPLIRAAADRGATGEAIYRRITLSMDVNPFFVTGYSIFNADLLHDSPFFYRLGMADFQHGTPSWGASAAGFAILGLVLACLSVGLRRIRKT